MQHAFNQHWTLSADYTHEQGNHGYRGYSLHRRHESVHAAHPDVDPNYDPDQASVVPNLNLFKSDNRSSYNALMIVAAGQCVARFNLIAQLHALERKTWGCVLGELFDYVNGVCDPLNPFGPGDYGPSGEDVTHRFVLAGTLAPSGRHRTDHPHPGRKRAPHHAHHCRRDSRAVDQRSGDRRSTQFRGTPFIQVDIRVSRPFKIRRSLGSSSLRRVLQSLQPQQSRRELRHRPHAASGSSSSGTSRTTSPTSALTADCSTTKPITSLKQLASRPAAWETSSAPAPR